jgi:hypothetical protein
MRASRRRMRFSLLSLLFGVRETREDRTHSFRNTDKSFCHFPGRQCLFSSQGFLSLVKVLALSIAVAATIKVFQTFGHSEEHGYSRASVALSIV